MINRKLLPIPFCPECDYEIDALRKGFFNSYFWKCNRCENYYKCLTADPLYAHEVVERLVGSDFRRGRLKYPY